MNIESTRAQDGPIGSMEAAQATQALVRAFKHNFRQLCATEANLSERGLPASEITIGFHSPLLY